MFIGYFNPANMVTLLGLVSSVLAIMNAIQGNIKFAVVMFLLAGLCDMFDGRIARSTKMRNEAEKVFGVQIDTVCDMVSFGIVPIVITYCMGYKDVADLIIYLAFAVCGATRLAYFNTMAITRPDVKQKYFIGFPIPFICYILPLLVLIKGLDFIPDITMGIIFNIVLAVIAILYVLKIKIKKISLGTGIVLAAAQIIVIALLFLIPTTGI